MTSKEWEKRTLEEDKKIQKKITKYKNSSTRRVILGLFIAVFGCEKFNDVINKVTPLLGEYKESVSEKTLSLDVIAGGFSVVAKGMDGTLLTISLALLLLALAAFLWAISTRNKAEDLDAKMHKWMPDEAEIADIRSRFDNDFIRGVLSDISASETESVTVALEGILIESNEGEKKFNFNKEGFRRLTNYESKQLAFFIGSEAFPDGFIIHQLKKHATVYDNYVRGYTETGAVSEKKPDETEVAKKNLRWLLKEISTLTGNKKLKPEDEPVNPVVIEGGHIVINKGYSEKSEKYKLL
jgi:nitrogen fixation-related uncharacterized protein